MNDKLQILLKQINYSEENYNSFDNGKLIKIVGNKNRDNYCFMIDLVCPLSVEAYDEFINKLPLGFPTVKTVDVKFNISEIKEEDIKNYINYFIDSYSKNNTLLSMFKDNKVELENNNIIFEVGNLAEKMKLSSVTSNLLNDLNRTGFKDYNISIEINDSINEKITEEINKSLVVEVPVQEKKIVEEKKNDKPVYNRQTKKSDDPNVVLGRLVDGKITTINNIYSEEDNLIVDAYVFGIDFFESSKSDFKIITLKITDYTDSMYCKVFVRGDEEYKNLKKSLGVGKWFKIRGYTKNDVYSKELVLNARDINILDKKAEKIVDDAEVKRVELHAHTMMSQMDGLTKLDLGKHTCELISRAMDME